jgi:hypothetical protein
VREYIRRGGHVVAQAVIDGERFTNSDLTSYLKTVIKYALDGAETCKAINPEIRSLLVKVKMQH